MSKKKAKESKEAPNFAVDDIVLVKKPQGKPLPAKIVSFGGGAKNPKATVKVFYSASDFPRGVKVPLRTADQEVYTTDATDEYPLSQIKSLATIKEVSVNDLPENDPFAENIDEDKEITIFYTRFFYDTKTKDFTPIFKTDTNPLIDSTVKIRSKRGRGSENTTTTSPKKKKGRKTPSSSSSSSQGIDDEEEETEEDENTKKQVQKKNNTKKKNTGEKTPKKKKTSKSKQDTNKQSSHPPVGQCMLIVQPTPEDPSYSKDFPFWVAQEISLKRKKYTVIFYESNKLLGSYTPIKPIYEYIIHQDGVIVSGFHLLSDGTLPSNIIKEISEKHKPNEWSLPTNEIVTLSEEQKKNVVQKSSSSSSSSPSPPIKKIMEEKKKVGEIIPPSPPKSEQSRVLQAEKLARDALMKLQEDPADTKQAAKLLKVAYFVLEPPSQSRFTKSPNKINNSESSFLSQPSTPLPSIQTPVKENKTSNENKKKQPTKKVTKPKEKKTTGKKRKVPTESKQEETEGEEEKVTEKKNTKKKRVTRNSSPIPEIPEDPVDVNDGSRRRSSRQTTRPRYNPNGLIQQSILRDLPVQAPKLRK